jgi:hypothetical protein
MEPEDIWRDRRAILRLSPTPDAVNDGFRVHLSYASQSLEGVVKFRIDTRAQKIGQ